MDAAPWNQIAQFQKPFAGCPVDAPWLTGVTASPHSAGCDNTSAITQGDMFRRDAPTVADYRFLLRGSKGPFPDREPAQLYARACVQGWPGTCRIQ